MGEALLIKFGGEVANPYEGIEVAPGYASVLLTVLDSSGNVMQGMWCNCGGITNTTNALGQAVFLINSTAYTSVTNWCINTNKRYIDQANNYFSINPTNYEGQNYFNKILPITVTLGRVWSFNSTSNYNNSQAYLAFRVSNNIVNLYVSGGGGGSSGAYTPMALSGVVGINNLHNTINNTYLSYGEILFSGNGNYINRYGRQYLYSANESSYGGHGGGGAETYYIPKIIDVRNKDITRISLGRGGRAGTPYCRIDNNTGAASQSYTSQGGTGGTSTVTIAGAGTITAIGGTGSSWNTCGLGGNSGNSSTMLNGRFLPGMDGGYRGQNSTSSNQNAYCGGGGGGWDPSSNTYGSSINGGGCGDYVTESNKILTLIMNFTYPYSGKNHGRTIVGGSARYTNGNRGGGGGGTGLGWYDTYKGRFNVTGREGGDGYISFEME